MNSGSCRIIGGKWRSRKIKFDDALGLRPTTDRIRETVFNWLQPYIQQSCCLDAFAGSGVLGFEALSRGAQDVVFIENNIKTVKNINENISILDVNNATVFQQDVFVWLSAAQCSQKFNLVFLDPPFYADLLLQSSVMLNNSGCLAEDAIIYVEHHIKEDFVPPENWVNLKQKKAGQVVYELYEYRSNNDV